MPKKSWPQKDRCARCNEAGWSAKNVFVGCDGCERGWHISCARWCMPVTEDDPWYCPDCKGGPGAGGDVGGAGPVGGAQRAAANDSQPPAARFKTTFVSAPPPKLDKKKRREAAGLKDGTVATLEDRDRLLDNSLAPKTRQKYQRVKEKFLAHAERTQLGVTVDALELYATQRVLDGVAGTTVKGDVSIVKATIPELVVPADRSKRLGRAIDRMAEQPDCAKSPITPAEVVELLHQVETRPYAARSNLARDVERKMRLRDRVFFLLAFLGIPRGVEMAKIEWDHLRAVWGRPGEELLTQMIDWVPPPRLGFELYGLRLYWVESKGDLKGKGQWAAVRNVEDVGPRNNPVQLLLDLYRARRPNQRHVFVDMRPGFSLSAMSESTFRDRLKFLLETFLPEDRVRQLSLHSLRKGGSSTAANAGLPYFQIVQQGRWVSDRTPLRFYTRLSDESSFDFSLCVLSTLKFNP